MSLILGILGVVILLAALLSRAMARAPAAELVSEPDAAEVPRISAPALAAMLERADPVLVVDVRKPGDLDRDPRRIPTAVHYPPDEAASRIIEQAPAGPIVLYCA